MDTDPSVPSDHDGVFEWLEHDPVPTAAPDHDAVSHAADRPVAHRVVPAPTHARLDPLTVQGVINRVLVLVFCLIAVGASYEAFAAVTSSRVPRTTAVTPSLLSSTTTAPAKVAAKVAPKRTTTTRAPTTTAPPPTTPTTTTPVTTPRTTPRTAPRSTTPPATFRRPVVTSPPTTPQTIRVPATTPTTAPTGPSDTVVVPFK
jgi:hypothetical protein